MLEPGRTLAPILQELLVRYHNGTHENFIPTNYPDFIITMVMQGFESSWGIYKAYNPNASTSVNDADTFWPPEVGDKKMMDEAAMPSPYVSDDDIDVDEWSLHQFLNIDNPADEAAGDPVVPPDVDEADAVPVVHFDAASSASDDDLALLCAPPEPLSFE